MTLGFYSGLVIGIVLGVVLMGAFVRFLFWIDIDNEEKEQWRRHL